MIDLETTKMAWALLDRRERRHAWIVLAVVVVSALSTAVMVASIMPFLAVLADPAQIHGIGFLNRVYKWGEFDDTYDFLFFLGSVSIFIILAANAIQILRVFVVARYAIMRTHSISVRLLSSFLRQPYSYFLLNHSGEMGTKVLSESQQVVTQFFRPTAEACAAVSTIGALLAVLLFVDPILTLVVFAVFGCIYGTALMVSHRFVTHLGRERVTANNARFKIANEALSGVREIKLLGREHAYLDRYSKPSLRMAKTMAYVTAIAQLPQYVLQATAFSGLIVLCLVLLGDPTEQSRENLAELLPTLGLLAFAGQRMIPELSRLFQSLTNLSYGEGAVHAVYKIVFMQGGAVAIPKMQVEPLRLRDSLIFESVWFRYGANTRANLSNISLQIRAGERIGIVGATGSGKSTLANILLGLTYATEGRVIVDGTVISSDCARNWQRSVGYVPQEIFLIDATIRENIAFGLSLKEIDEDCLLRAAKNAQIHHFITTELEAGYDTKIGERGIRLSGGQRQRMGIARALYNDVDLIVLDEATSALDNVTEKEVMRAIENLPSGKTAVLIAHRLSTLKVCDRIAILENGTLHAIDSWDVLLRENEMFQSMVAASEFPTSEGL